MRALALLMSISTSYLSADTENMVMTIGGERSDKVLALNSKLQEKQMDIFVKRYK